MEWTEVIATIGVAILTSVAAPLIIALFKRDESAARANDIEAATSISLDTYGDAAITQVIEQLRKQIALMEADNKADRQRHAASQQDLLARVFALENDLKLQVAQHASARQRWDVERSQFLDTIIDYQDRVRELLNILNQLLSGLLQVTQQLAPLNITPAFVIPADLQARIEHVRKNRWRTGLGTGRLGNGNAK